MNRMRRAVTRATAAAPGSRAGTAPPDEGRIMLLGLLYGLLAILLVTVVVSATGVHLERKRLLALADLAALEAADALDQDAYFRRAGTRTEEGDHDTGDDPADVLVLTEASITDAVTDQLAVAGAPTGLTDLTLVDATTDGTTVTVTLAATSHPVLLTWVTAGWADGIDLVVTSSARAG